MDMALMGMQSREVFVYLDDIVVDAKTLTEHNEKYRKVFDRLRKSNYCFNRINANFSKEKLFIWGISLAKFG